VDANPRHHRRHSDHDVSERSRSTALPRALRGENGEVRHSDRKDDKGHSGSTDDQEGVGMDHHKPSFAFTGMEPLPVADDDDEIVSVGNPIWDVVKVEVAGPLTLFVEFGDGVKGTVSFADSFLSNVWAKLRDPDYFAQVGIAHGAVSWPNEEPDMCPSAMYDEIVKHNGKWVVN
jgi:hypothetical protein